jgi:hypothetical protein
MNSLKFGNWTASTECDQYCVADTADFFINSDRCDDDDEANSRLLAAAPDLYRALKEAIQSCPCSLKERDSGHRVDCFVPGALAAIAKVEEPDE